MDEFCKKFNMKKSYIDTTVNTYNNFEKLIDEKNERFIQKEMVKEKDYLDNVLKSVDPVIDLDEDQRRVVLSDEDYTLVIAGAGAGQTTTVAAKVKYLVDKKDIDPKKILVISFTNKAVAFVSLVIIYRHRMNIVRIAKGTEFSLYDTFGKKKKEENEA